MDAEYTRNLLATYTEIKQHFPLELSNLFMLNSQVCSLKCKQLETAEVPGSELFMPELCLRWLSNIKRKLELMHFLSFLSFFISFIISLFPPTSSLMDSEFLAGRSTYLAKGNDFFILQCFEMQMQKVEISSLECPGMTHS